MLISGWIDRQNTIYADGKHCLAMMERNELLICTMAQMNCKTLRKVKEVKGKQIHTHAPICVQCKTNDNDTKPIRSYLLGQVVTWESERDQLQRNLRYLWRARRASLYFDYNDVWGIHAIHKTCQILHSKWIHSLHKIIPQ